MNASITQPVRRPRLSTLRRVVAGAVVFTAAFVAGPVGSVLGQPVDAAQAASYGIAAVDPNSTFGLNETGSGGDQHFLYPGQSSLRYNADANSVWLDYGICWKYSKNGSGWLLISAGYHSIPDGYYDKFFGFFC